MQIFSSIQGAAASLHQRIDDAVAAVAAAGGIELLRPGERPGKSVVWSLMTPHLAQEAARVIESAPRLFSGLDFTAGDLLADAAAVLVLEHGRAQVQRLLDSYVTHLNRAKTRLYHRVQLVGRTVRALTTLPLMDEEQRDALEKAARVFRAQLEKDNRRSARTREQAQRLLPP